MIYYYYLIFYNVIFTTTFLFLEPLIVSAPIVCPSLELCDLRCEFGLFQNKWGCVECKCATSDGNLSDRLLEWKDEKNIEHDNNLERNNNDNYMSEIFNKKSLGLYLIDEANNSSEKSAACMPLSAENCDKLVFFMEKMKTKTF